MVKGPYEWMRGLAAAASLCLACGLTESSKDRDATTGGSEASDGGSSSGGSEPGTPASSGNGTRSATSSGGAGTPGEGDSGGSEASGSGGDATGGSGGQGGAESLPESGGATNSGGGSGESTGGVGGCECLVDDDCATQQCNDDGFCEPPSCEDGVQNGSEIEVDCGGAACPPCQRAKSCVAGDCPEGAGCVCDLCLAGRTDDEEVECCSDDECPSRLCSDYVCLAASCADAVQNGDETDVDCGGASCDPCPVGARCISDADCVNDHCATLLERSADCGDVVRCDPR